MSFARNNRHRWGLRARLTLWTAAVLAASLVAGFAWVHRGLRQVLESRTDAFLESKSAELSAAAIEARSDGRAALQEEIRREVVAYEAEGLVVVVRQLGIEAVAPETSFAWRVNGVIREVELDTVPRTLDIHPERFRVVRARLQTPGEPLVVLDLAVSLAETEATLTQFAARAAWGGLAFVAVAVAGGLLLSRQALRPVARSIATARRLNPADLSARLPRSGAGDELDQLAGTINDLLDRLASYHAQITRFTADASHELRSPLGAMRASVDVALQQPRTVEEYRDVLGSLGEQCDRLAALVGALLLLARADTGEVEIRREPIDLGDLADDVLEMYGPLADERGITLIWQRLVSVPALGDGSRIMQLLTNLVDNAIKFTGPGGSVMIRIESFDDRSELIVADTGSGIEAEHLVHVFDRFYQADPARSVGGAGLGLSLCRWIAEAHGGSIRAESRPGQGSTFTVILPPSPVRDSP